MTMDTNDIMMRTLDRIVLGLERLQEELRAQNEHLAARDRRSAAAGAAFGRLRSEAEARTQERLTELHRDIIRMQGSFALMNDRLTLAALEETAYSSRIEHVDERLSHIRERVQRLEGRVGAVERRRGLAVEP
jgi:chromosome segregation ATPase